MATSPDKRLLVVGGAGLALFALLLVGAIGVYESVVSGTGIAALDRRVLDWMVANRTPEGAAWASVFTHLGSTIPMVALGLTATTLIWLRWRRRTAWVLMLIAATGSVSFTIISKRAIGRSRPPLADAVPPYETSFSFPSGHTLNSTVVAGMLANLLAWLARTHRTRILAILAAGLWTVSMGLTRVYLGHHWISDVAFAWLFGLAWLVALITAHRVILHLQARPPTSPVSGHS